MFKQLLKMNLILFVGVITSKNCWRKASEHCTFSTDEKFKQLMKKCAWIRLALKVCGHYQKKKSITFLLIHNIGPECEKHDNN